MFFAVIAIGLLGVVSLATEAGTWYLTRSTSDNAADAAAAAAALAVSVGADYQSAGAKAATSNGYTAGNGTTVTVNNPPASGSYTTNSAAAEVLINVTETPLLSSVFTNLTPVVASRGVALVETVGTACVLSTLGDLQITQTQGSTSSGALGCIYASNATDGTAVNIPSAAITAYGVTSVGTCTGCSNAQDRLLRPAASYQPPTINPYGSSGSNIDGLSLPTTFQSICIPSPVPAAYQLVPATANGTFTVGSSCASPATGTTKAYAWTTGQSYFAYEANLVIPAGTTLTLVPGTYFFVNASLTLNGGTIQCKVSTASGAAACQPGLTGQGVTIVMMGNPSTSVGNLKIGAAASVNLGALASQSSTFTNSSGLGSAYAALNGILFYRRGTATSENVGSPGVNISGKATSPYTVLNGGMYFPSSYVSYGANGCASNNSSCAAGCAIIVAGYLSLANTASQFSSANCTSVYNTATPKVQAVRMAE